MGAELMNQVPRLLNMKLKTIIDLSAHTCVPQFFVTSISRILKIHLNITIIYSKFIFWFSLYLVDFELICIFFVIGSKNWILLMMAKFWSTTNIWKIENKIFGIFGDEQNLCSKIFVIQDLTYINIITSRNFKCFKEYFQT